MLQDVDEEQAAQDVLTGEEQRALADEFLTEEQAAQMLGLRPIEFVEQFVVEGKIPLWRVSSVHQRYVKKSDVAALVSGGAVNG